MPRKLVLILWFSLVLVAAGPLAGACQASGDYSEARGAMVARQLKGRGIAEARVLAAMGKVPRHLFVPPELASQAYGDYPLPIGRRPDHLPALYRGPDEPVGRSQAGR